MLLTYRCSLPYGGWVSKLTCFLWPVGCWELWFCFIFTLKGWSTFRNWEISHTQGNQRSGNSAHSSDQQKSSGLHCSGGLAAHAPDCHGITLDPANSSLSWPCTQKTFKTQYSGSTASFLIWVQKQSQEQITTTKKTNKVTVLRQLCMSDHILEKSKTWESPLLLPK